MNLTLTPSIILNLTAAAITLMAAAVNWTRRKTPAMKMLAYVLVSISIWSIFSALELIAIEADTKIYFFTIEYTASYFLVLLFLLFVIDKYEIIPWLTARVRFRLFVILGVEILLVWTNPLHHLYWTSYTLGGPGLNKVILNYGPGFALAEYTLVLPIFTSYVLQIIQIIRLRGPKRHQALWILLASLLPMISYQLYLFPDYESYGLDLFPLMYSLTGLILTYVVFAEVNTQLQTYTSILEVNIQHLDQEISERILLEKDLRESQDSLSDKLAEQSRKLAGLYDLVLIGEDPEQDKQLEDQLLNMVCSILGCDTAVFYNNEDGQVQIKAHAGLDAIPLLRLQELGSPDGMARSSIWVFTSSGGTELPAEVASAGYSACTLKRIEIRQRELGLMACFWKNAHQFKVDEIALAGMMADIVGVVMENERLRQMTGEIARIDERRRLARDLHDSVTQSLYSLSFSADTAMHILNTKPEKLPVILQHLSTSARQAVKEMRLLLFDMRLIPIQDIDLVEAITLRLETVERRAGVEASMIIDQNVQFPKPWNQQIYPIIMEALNNALRHSRAKQVNLHIFRQNNLFCIQIQDNGKGFETDSVVLGGMGLRNMKERAEKLGGRLSIDSSPENGTLVQLLVPVV